MEIDEKEFNKMKTDLADSLEASKALQGSVTKLEENNKALLKEKSEAKTATQQAIEDAAKKSGDVEALEKSWQAKLIAETDPLKADNAKHLKTISSMTVGVQAANMANDLALQGSSDVLLPHIQKRLTVEMGEGEPVIRVLDINGQPSALSIEDLKKEISANPAYAPILVGTKASGSGNVGNKGGGADQKTITREAFDGMDQAQRSAHFNDGGKISD
ncbi:MAG: hypothetical protein KAT90_11080 [Gammaproteobacteria bacterium]|nr:hypothetical protein [Gammaproteobacteria bacterium]